jgi:hypothetical protein
VRPLTSDIAAPRTLPQTLAESNRADAAKRVLTLPGPLEISLAEMQNRTGAGILSVALPMKIPFVLVSLNNCSLAFEHPFRKYVPDALCPGTGKFLGVLFADVMRAFGA